MAKKTHATVFPQIAWGSDRHRLIAAAAQLLLKPNTAAKTKAIVESLNMGQNSIKDIATWADDIKYHGASYKDANTVAFLAQYTNSREWHFVDLPLGAGKYDRAALKAFTSDTDIVQILVKCIEVMQGKSTFVSEANALRLVVHLIGDLHQPLHMACGYIKEDGDTVTLMSDPKQIVDQQLTGKSDHGGNNIVLPGGTNLHSHWDDDVVDDPAIGDIAAPDPAILTKDHLEPVPAGDLSQWPIGWATDAAVIAPQAYAGFTLAKTTKKGKYKVTNFEQASYDKKFSPMVLTQLKHSAHRLALLLNTIYV